MIFKKNTGGTGPDKNAEDKVSAAKLRLQNDIAEYKVDEIKSVEIKFPNEKNMMEILVTPTNETVYHGGTYKFTLDFPTNYPIKAPKLLLKNKIFHPNMDYEGHVCLPLVRDDWKPIHTLYDIICGLIYLFGSPNPKDPLNAEAGALMHENIDEFKKVVKETLKGGKYKGQQFDKMIK
jgi:ubiquitin-conjugating enzyme E2 M